MKLLHELFVLAVGLLSAFGLFSIGADWALSTMDSRRFLNESQRTDRSTK
jgi:hypothetical protein